MIQLKDQIINPCQYQVEIESGVTKCATYTEYKQMIATRDARINHESNVFLVVVAIAVGVLVLFGSFIASK